MDSRVRPEFSQRVLPIDDAITTRCRNEADAISAATALVQGLAVVTRNIQDFQGTVLYLSIHGEPKELP
jgi:predicted nucleic acid-binding protein